MAEDGTHELGMEFNMEEDAYKFYNKYAFKMGFSVRKDYLNKHKDYLVYFMRLSLTNDIRSSELKNLESKYNHQRGCTYS